MQGEKPRSSKIQFTVSKTPRLNLLGRDAIVKLDLVLQEACEQLCVEFPDLFKPELGCLKDFQLEVKFKPEAKSVFCKPRVVPFALLEDLNQAYDAGIAQEVWKPVQFNSYGTPVVPIRKSCTPNQAKARIRVCGDYSVSVNPQLEPHHYPMHLPEDLMRKLSGGHGFTKVDLADAYNQVMLGPESQKLSTHRGVLLQLCLPFGISSAPGYFQEIMDQLIGNLGGVTSYMDDILVSGSNASEHLQNLRALLQRLQDKGLHCRKEKCLFAQPSIEYLGYTLSSKGVAKGRKADAELCCSTRLAHWALLLNQYSYSIEYRTTADHGNANALTVSHSVLTQVSMERKVMHMDTVCAIRTISLQLNPTDPGVLAKESAKDPVLAKVMLFTYEGWSPKAEPEDQGKDYSVEDSQLHFQLFMVVCYMAPESSFLLALNLKSLNSCIWVTSGCRG
eukprot:Em0016g670a